MFFTLPTQSDGIGTAGVFFSWPIPVTDLMHCNTFDAAPLHIYLFLVYRVHVCYCTPAYGHVVVVGGTGSW